MSQAHEIVSDILSNARVYIESALKTMDVDGFMINSYIEYEIERHKVKSFNKGYHPSWAPGPYPASCCITVNSMICHGIPSAYVFRKGDVFSVDVGIITSDGQCGDAAFSMGVGEISNERKKLLRHARGCVYAGIEECRAGASTLAITRAMERYASNRGYRLNSRFGGHGIGKKMHEPPHIYSVHDSNNTYELLKVGQVVCLEPMLTTGNDQIGVRAPDGWMYMTRDGKPSVFYEHMVRITENEPEVLTTHFTNSLFE